MKLGTRGRPVPDTTDTNTNHDAKVVDRLWLSVSLGRRSIFFSDFDRVDET